MGESNKAGNIICYFINILLYFKDKHSN